jgi:signal transduction histidine kinase
MKSGGSLTAAIESMGEEWQVSFIDTGTGMTAQQIEKIFEPFQSNFEGGTGLGLAIVYQIVQAHEGKVWARSKPGQGTTFVLRMRRLDAERTISAEQVGTARNEKSRNQPSPQPIAVAAAGGARG